MGVFSRYRILRPRLFERGSLVMGTNFALTIESTRRYKDRVAKVAIRRAKRG